MPFMAQNLIVEYNTETMHSSGEEVVPESTRQVDFSDVHHVRIGYTGRTGSGTVRFRAEYSLDGGTTWADLTPYGPNLTTSIGNKAGQWEPLPDPIRGAGDILLRCYADGTASASYYPYSIAVYYR